MQSSTHRDGPHLYLDWVDFVILLTGIVKLRPRACRAAGKPYDPGVMIFFSTRTRRRFWSLGGPWIVAFGLAGCDRDDVKVYRVTKEQTPAQQPSAAPMPSGHPEVNAAKPQLAWTLPSGWVQTGPGKMSVASFTIAGKDGKEAQVTVTPLQGLAGKEALIVNMWRQQAGLPELTAEAAARQLSPVDVGGDPGKMFEVTGKGDGTNPPLRIVTAMAHRADGSWFYKLAGDADLVEAQKPAFVGFLKSVKISASTAAAEIGRAHV